MSPSVSKVLQTRKCSPSRCSILNSLAAAAEDGVALASELVYNLKGSLYSILPHSLRGKVSDDWDSMLSSSLLEHFMGRLDGNIQGTSSWLTNPSSFKRVIKKVSGNVAANANALRKRHHSIEDLLSTIESYERAGLISDLESFGFSEEAWFLQDRCVLYALFARFRTLQEALNLLCFMRLETRLPFHDTWSFACSDDRCRNYLKKIRDICGFDDKIKTFAWKLDKLELCALEVDRKISLSLSLSLSRALSVISIGMP
ncbi:hypothetical protein KP509_14G070700 [Ceratopteris richardii]|nr:hypothetical protein KP509_14G070700 [Ceratopteris richardii]